MKIYKHIITGDILTDVIISANQTDANGLELYSYRYPEEGKYRTVTEKLFFDCFTEGVITTDSEFVEYKQSVYISSFMVQPYSKRIVLWVDKASIDSSYQGGNIFRDKQKAIKFFDNIIAQFPGFTVNIKDSGD